MQLNKSEQNQMGALAAVMTPALAQGIIAKMEKQQAEVIKGTGNRAARRKAKHQAPNPEIVRREAAIKGANKGKDAVAAGFNATAYGTKLAEAYDAGMQQAGQSWQESIIYLLKTANDVQREAAMSAVIVYCKKISKEKGADFRVTALKKRVSEARRVFKAATVKGHAEIVKTMEGAGSWHQKIAAMPKASTKGAKKGAKTPVASKSEAIAAVSGMAKGHEKVHAVSVGDVVGLTKQLSTGNMLIVLDVIAFELSKSVNLYEQGLGKQVMQFRDRQEKATLKAATG